MWYITDDDELLQHAGDAEQQKRRLSQQREIQRASNVALEFVTSRPLV